nr:epoxyqueuosine reductase [uncultured Aminipila sp.]
MEKRIQEKAYQLGYEKCGIIPIHRLEGFKEKLEERIEKVPYSKAFYEGQRRLADVRENYPWAKAIVVLAVNYAQYKVPSELGHRIAKAYLFDNRMNEQSSEFKMSVAMEEYLLSMGLKVATNRNFGVTGLRWAAREASLGVVRKNNFFYTDLGSWNHLEGFLVDHEMEIMENSEVAPCPEGCNKCIDCCPTKALIEPYTLQPMACISFLTTFGGRDLPHEALSKQFNGCIYGCDICQNVCPMNKEKWDGTDEFPGLSELTAFLTPQNILKLSEEQYRKKIQPKFFYLSPEELWKWKVNALCFMRNSAPGFYKTDIQNTCFDNHPKVREMAQNICEELKY